MAAFVSSCYKSRPLQIQLRFLLLSVIGFALFANLTPSIHFWSVWSFPADAYRQESRYSRSALGLTRPELGLAFFRSLPRLATVPSTTKFLHKTNFRRFNELLNTSSSLFLLNGMQTLIVRKTLLCGDIEPNPGPTNFKFPCGRCSKPVRKNQNGILCEAPECSRWFHAKCVDLSPSSFRRLGDSEEEWLCPSCCFPPFTDSFFDPPSSPATPSPTPPTDTSHSNQRPRTNNNLSFFYANVRSIKNKLKDLELLLKNDFSVIGLVETWLDDNVIDSEIFPTEYVVFRKDRSSHGGGVLLAIHEDLHPTPIDIPDNCTRLRDSTQVELTFASFTINQRRVAVGCAYRPPSATHEYTDTLCEALESLEATLFDHDVVILLGDFNYNINWTQLQASSEDARKFLNASTNLALTQLVSEPTLGNNTPDLVFLNDTRFLKSISISDNLPNCDHHAVTFFLECSKPSPTKIKRRVLLYDKADVSLLNNLITDAPWDLALSDSIDETWETWLDIFWGCVNSAVPNKFIQNRKRSPWISASLVHRANIKRSLFKKAKKTNKDTDWNKYKSFSNQLRDDTSSAHKAYINNITKERYVNPKRFWGFFRAKTQISPPSAFTLGSSIFTRTTEIAQAFGSFFHQNFSRPRPTPSPTVACSEASPPSSLSPSLDIPSITPREVLHALNRTNSNSAPGHDLITPKLLKLIKFSLANPLAMLFNHSLKLGSLPSDWKMANIVPIFKGKGKRNSISNYRPISLTSIVGKLMERILFVHLSSFCENNMIIPPTQFGFRRNRSCTIQLIDSIHKWASTLDERSPKDIHVLFLDWAKAFDSVCHTKLVQKLLDIGVTGNTLNWLISFLSHRHQRVTFRGSTSNYLPVLSGVPQGSILGPLLFNILMSDLQNIFPAQIDSWQYADDCYFSCPINSTEDFITLQSTLSRISVWGANNGLNLNIDKCSYMILSRRRVPQDFQYSLNSTKLNKVSQMKVLGVVITSDLKWSAHVNHVTAKARRTLGIIRRSTGTSHASVVFFRSMCLPTLEYASQVWAPHLSKDEKAIEAVQKYFTRMILRTPKPPNPDYIPYEQRLAALSLSSLSDRRNFQSLCLFYKLVNINPILPTPSSLSVNTRHSTLTYNIPYARCDSLKHSFYHRCIRLWNDLPPHIRLSSSFSSFRQSLREHLHC